MRIPATSNTTPSGAPQGTTGGRARSHGSRPGSMNLNLGDEMYLWVLVILEALTLGWLRNHFRRHHGG